MWDNVEIRTVNLTNVRQINEIRSFLAGFTLAYDAAVDYTAGFYKDDQLVATGSLKGEVLRNIAVDESLQGEGLTATVLSHLMNEAARRGQYHYFIFTKVSKAHLFIALGFKEIARVEPLVVLLESGIGSIHQYTKKLHQLAAGLTSGRRAGLVMNCNPFTVGHLAVIEKAAAENESVIVMVVSEEQSLFPFDVRLELVRRGVSHLKNVVVIPSGKYVISSATFPGYFTSGDDTFYAQTRLDAVIYAKYIAKVLAIKARYVGAEPYCPVTRSYNKALQEVLPQEGVKVVIMPRVKCGTEAVSASKVRKLLGSGAWGEIKELVPTTTYEYLMSEQAKPIIEKVRISSSRH